MLIERICQNVQCRKSFFVEPWLIAQGWGNYCSKPCVYCSYALTPVEERFWKQVQRCDHELWCLYCCWEWQGATCPNGYGRISIKIHGKWKSAITSRIAWEILQKRPLPPGLKALHHCDNPPCCNALHLYAGTQRDNMYDAMKRQHRGDVRYVSGEAHRCAKLRAHDIPVIWAMRHQGVSLNQIARTFSVRKSAITSIFSYKSWARISRMLTAATYESSA